MSIGCNLRRIMRNFEQPGFIALGHQFFNSIESYLRKTPVFIGLSNMEVVRVEAPGKGCDAADQYVMLRVSA